MTGYKAVLSRKPVRRFLGAQIVSSLGDSAMWLACGIWVEQLTGSSSAAGLTFFFFLLPALGAPFAGLLADSFGRRRVLVLSNLLGALIVLLLLAVRGVGQVWLIYMVMGLYGAVTVVIGPAQSVLLTTLLGPGDLGAANGLLQGSRESLKLLAPVAGAGLFAVAGPHAVVVLDAGTFTVAAAVMLAVDTAVSTATSSTDDSSVPRGVVGEDGLNVPPNRGKGRMDVSWRAEVSAGFTHLCRVRVLLIVTVSCALFMLVAGFGESARWAIVTVGLGRPPTYVGTYQLFMGLGAVTGSVVARTVISRWREPAATGLGMAMFAGGALLSVWENSASVLTGAVLMGAGPPVLVIAAVTLVQRQTPPQLQGRAYASLDAVTVLPQVVSVGLGAGLVAVLDYRFLLAAIALVAAIAAVLSVAAGRWDDANRTQARTKSSIASVIATH